jgi:hypothetical protein
MILFLFNNVLLPVWRWDQLKLRCFWRFSSSNLFFDLSSIYKFVVRAKHSKHQFQVGRIKCRRHFFGLSPYHWVCQVAPHPSPVLVASYNIMPISGTNRARPALLCLTSHATALTLTSRSPRLPQQPPHPFRPPPTPLGCMPFTLRSMPSWTRVQCQWWRTTPLPAFTATSYWFPRSQGSGVWSSTCPVSTAHQGAAVQDGDHTRFNPRIGLSRLIFAMHIFTSGISAPPSFLLRREGLPIPGPAFRLGLGSADIHDRRQGVVAPIHALGLKHHFTLMTGCSVASSSGPWEGRSLFSYGGFASYFMCHTSGAIFSIRRHSCDCRVYTKGPNAFCICLFIWVVWVLGTRVIWICLAYVHIFFVLICYIYFVLISCVWDSK